MIVFIYQMNGYDRQYQSFDCYYHIDNKDENILNYFNFYWLYE